jgi:hypothetical protein
MNAMHNHMSFSRDPGIVLQNTRSSALLDNLELGGRNVESVNVRCQPRESLLCAVRSDERVDLDALDVVLLLQRGRDLALVGLGVDNEDERVVLLNLLHRGLGVERVDENLAGVEAGLARDRNAGVLGSAAAYISNQPRIFPSAQSQC